MFKSVTDFLIYAFLGPSTFAREQSADNKPPSPARGNKAYERGEDVEAQLYRKILNPQGKTQYGNMGYWTDGVETLDAAGEALARLLGQAGELKPGVRALDVGCGYGDEVIFWAKEFKPDHILAIDINPISVEAGQEWARALGLSERLEFRAGSAVALDLEPASVNQVLSLESPHTFLTRDAFLREAFRVLVPGGGLAMTDLLPLPGRVVHHFAFPPENAYSRDVLAQKLADAGFVQIEVKSIRQHVIKPYHRYLAKLPANRGLLGRIRMFQRQRVAAKLDYVLVTARKPN
ncbi:MAG: methyltransferase domain-containing protein [Acidobacteria bacterium]|nr:methyltransferase domain-containing protein [Acidobacteriota bacterium]